MDYHVLRCIGCFIAMIALEFIAAFLGPESLGFNVLMILSLVMMCLLVILQIFSGKNKRDLEISN